MRLLFRVDIIAYRYHFDARLVNSCKQAYFSRMSAQFPATGRDLADLIVYLARLGQSSARSGDEGSSHMLTAAQWTALRYFAHANRFSRTPSAFSEYHATTRGTASQTVKSLVALGLLMRQTHATDGRSTLIEVTAQGHEMLRQDPMRDLRRALDSLEPAARAAVAEALGHAITHLAHDRKAPVFGSCADCTHCQTENAASYCHCTQSVLSVPEMHALCVDFQPTRRPA